MAGLSAARAFLVWELKLYNVVRRSPLTQTSGISSLRKQPAFHKVNTWALAKQCSQPVSRFPSMEFFHLGSVFPFQAIS